MGQVSITLNDRTYRLVCGDGEEDRLVALAGYVKSKVEQLGAELGHVGDERLMLIAALTIADELFDARAAAAVEDAPAVATLVADTVPKDRAAAATEAATDENGEMISKLKTVAALMAAKQGNAAQAAVPPLPSLAAKLRRRDVR
jgi:cell division protein ZapA